MYVRKDIGPVEVTLPNGRKLNRSDLPARKTKRWVARHKSTVVEAVEYGLITSDDACDMYNLSNEELASWIGLHRKDGMIALRATALGTYR